MKGKLSMHQENKGPKYFFKKEYNMETENKLESPK